MANAAKKSSQWATKTLRFNSHETSLSNNKNPGNPHKHCVFGAFCAPGHMEVYFVLCTKEMQLPFIGSSLFRHGAENPFFDVINLDIGKMLTAVVEIFGSGKHSGQENGDTHAFLDIAGKNFTVEELATLNDDFFLVTPVFGFP